MSATRKIEEAIYPIEIRRCFKKDLQAYRESGRRPN